METKPDLSREAAPQPDLLQAFENRQVTIFGYTGTFKDLAAMCPVDLNDGSVSLEEKNEFVIKAANEAGLEIEPEYEPLFKKVLEEKGLESKFVVLKQPSEKDIKEVKAISDPNEKDTKKRDIKKTGAMAVDLETSALLSKKSKEDLDRNEKLAKKTSTTITQEEIQAMLASGSVGVEGEAETENPARRRIVQADSAAQKSKEKKEELAKVNASEIDYSEPTVNEEQVFGMDETIVRNEGLDLYEVENVEHEIAMIMESEPSDMEQVDNPQTDEVVDKLPEPEIPKISDEALVKVADEIFSEEEAAESQTKAQETDEFEEFITVKFEELEEENLEFVVQLTIDAYEAIEKIAETIDVLNKAIAEKPEEDLLADGSVVELEQALEEQIKEFEEICEQLLEQLGVPVEAKNARLMMRLLLRSEFKEKLEALLISYEKGTQEFKVPDTTALSGKIFDFVSANEAKIKNLGRRALEHLGSPIPELSGSVAA